VSDITVIVSPGKGDKLVTLYKVADTRPDTPTGNAPAGWTSAPQDGINWASVAWFNALGVLIGAWSTPVRWSGVPMTEVTQAIADHAGLDNLVHGIDNADAIGVLNKLRWNATEETVEFDLNDEVTLQIGQEQVVHARNATGSPIANGAVIYINGAVGGSGKPTIEPADASAASTSERTIGLATQDIADGADGFVTISGLVRGLDTSALTEGALVYLDTIAGGMTSSKPAQPNAVISVGFCIYRHAKNGMVFVSVNQMIGHAASHQHGGSDEIGTATPAANALPKADGSGTLNGWITAIDGGNANGN